MNKSNLKSYAPQARRDFIAAVTARANLLGISSNAIAPSELRGDIVIIEGREWPAKVAGQRDKLIARIKKDGFEHTFENVAYTWFNRFAALRFMELHDYLGHGWRVLSNREGGLPEILSHASDVALSSLNVAKARDMQLAGNQDNELYKMLLVAQCNELSRAMPFLFEQIDDETELLLPENLLRTDSIVAKLVASVQDEDWEQVEVIGWLYQFYISEKKDQVIGKVVKSEDIPAATQLFTPNWIVQYIVQNSVGRLWLMANPASTLKSQWPYYIEPAAQTPEVQAQLNNLIQTRVAEDGTSLNPESITVLDPACGSGHILVEAYELLKAIYLERGYRLRDIPRLILKKNLFGIDIDDRAAQLASFALIMKARADDRRLFDNTISMNIIALQGIHGIDDARLANSVFDAAISIECGYTLSNGELFGGSQLASRHSSGLKPNDLRELIQFFAHAKTFGSLLTVPTLLAMKLGKLGTLLQQVEDKGNTLAQSYARQIHEHYLVPALILTKLYDAVVANPPYMGSKYLTPKLKDYLKANYKGFEKDLFSAFMIRDLALTKPAGQLGFMSPFVWMFISSYEELRHHFINQATLTSLVQLEYSGFDGATVPICTFTLAKAHATDFVGSYIRLSDFRGADQQGPKTLEAIQNQNCGWFYTAKPDDFKKIPGSPVAYWASKNVLAVFDKGEKLSKVAEPRLGMATGNNDLYLRLWHEISYSKIGFGKKNREDAKKSGRKWFPYNKGGAFRRWFGNCDYVVNWENDGDLLQNTYHPSGDRIWAHNFNLEYIFKSCITWTATSSSYFAVRNSDNGFIFDNKGSSCFPQNGSENLVLGFLASSVVQHFMRFINPTIEFQPGNISSLAFWDEPLLPIQEEIEKNVIESVSIARSDWNSFETAWDFDSFVCVNIKGKFCNIKDAWESYRQLSDTRFYKMQELEKANNSLFITAYGLQDELSPEVSDDQITLARADREKDCQRLISYAIGCMMGRYSLDEVGLIYAHADNAEFDTTRYQTFPADADGIIPLTDELWFDDDAAHRVREFLLAVWGAATFDENLAWLAQSLKEKDNETPDETIRRYISASFYKNHLVMYRKRPIYWLFSSGKQGAFQALVYLHRYHEGTLSRMRAEYVVPLTAKFAARIEMLTQDAEQSGSAAARSKILKQIEALRKKQAELLTYDEKLRHYADMRIKLDLDDGVKVNYGKFGDLLAEVKAVTGGTGDD
jgi:type II restriction/modification system DNA methylase subunit YeeA